MLLWWPRPYVRETFGFDFHSREGMTSEVQCVSQSMMWHGQNPIE